MNETNLENVLMVIGNLAIFGLFAYVVFWLGHSGWWMVMPCFFHFRTSKSNSEEKLENIK